MRGQAVRVLRGDHRSAVPASEILQRQMPAGFFDAAEMRIKGAGKDRNVHRMFEYTR